MHRLERYAYLQPPEKDIRQLDGTGTEAEITVFLIRNFSSLAVTEIISQTFSKKSLKRDIENVAKR